MASLLLGTACLVSLGVAGTIIGLVVSAWRSIKNDPPDVAQQRYSFVLALVDRVMYAVSGKTIPRSATPECLRQPPLPPQKGLDAAGRDGGGTPTGQAGQPDQDTQDTQDTQDAQDGGDAQDGEDGRAGAVNKGSRCSGGSSPADDVNHPSHTRSAEAGPPLPRNDPPPIAVPNLAGLPDPLDLPDRPDTTADASDRIDHPDLPELQQTLPDQPGNPGAAGFRPFNQTTKAEIIERQWASAHTTGLAPLWTKPARLTGPPYTSAPALHARLGTAHSTGRASQGMSALRRHR